MNDEWWMIEVERPWVGMTSDGMTEVERARAELVKTLGGIREELGAHRTVERARKAVNDTMRSSAGRKIVVIALACCAGGATAPVLLAARGRKRRRPGDPVGTRRPERALRRRGMQGKGEKGHEKGVLPHRAAAPR